MNKSILKTTFLIAIFVLAISVWYSPILFKGYSNTAISRDVLLAKNYHQAGTFATQNNQSITVSSSLIEKEGRSLLMSQYLRSFFLAKIFDITGIPDYNNLVLISIILYAFVLVLFTILILYLFDFKIAIIFSLIYIFSPFGWNATAYSLGMYEFCLFFLALFFICYFIGIKKAENSKHWLSNLLFVFSGVFLVFSSLSKEISLVFASAFFIFLLVKKRKKQLIYIFIPFVILLMIFWAPSIIRGENKYLSFFTTKAPEESIFSFPDYAHVFPDPYTYFFEKEQFLEELKNQDLGWTENLQTKKSLTNYGFEQINLIERTKVGSYILFQHASRFVSLEDFGGPFILLLFGLGLVYLRKKYKFLYNLSLFWLVISIAVLSFVTLMGRNHLMDFIWVLALLIALGLIYLIKIIGNNFKLSGRKLIILNIILVGLVLYHFVLVNHVILGRQYDRDFMPRSVTYAKLIKSLDVQDFEVIAVPGNDSTLSYLTDKSFVVFQSLTLDKLIKENKIKQAFEAFGVKYILGYSDELSDRIISQVPVINITSNSLEIDMGQISPNKSFFMNIIR